MTYYDNYGRDLWKEIVRSNYDINLILEYLDEMNGVQWKRFMASCPPAVQSGIKFTIKTAFKAVGPEWKKHTRSKLGKWGVIPYTGNMDVTKIKW